MIEPVPEFKQGHSKAAARMRLARQRRREGLRYVSIELRETEIDALAKKGLLPADRRGDKNAIVDALYQFLENSLDIQM